MSEKKNDITADTSKSPRPVEVFYSYAHADEDFRVELVKHLRLLERQGVITGWHDRNISAGTDWKNSIDDHLESAEIILLLISADFLASDYCYDIELKRAMERHAEGKARVIPIIYRGAKLAVALEWRARNEGKLSELEREFLVASEALKVREEEKREAAQRRELEAAQKLAETERRSSARLRNLLAGLAILLIASAILSFIAYTRQQQAVAESKKNQELLYVADMKAAFQASERGDVEEVRRLLEAHLPSAGTDLRRFEWFWLWRVYHNEKAELKGHDDSVWSVAFSPDGKTLASGSWDKIVKLWDARTGRELATLKGHDHYVSSVAVSPDGKTLASGSGDKTVKLLVGSARE